MAHFYWIIDKKPLNCVIINIITKTKFMLAKNQILHSLIFLFFLSAYPFAAAQTVYITKTGEKYHRSTCRYLYKSSISISLSDALQKNYTACKVCKPNSTGQTKQKSNINSSKLKTSLAKQCSAKTSKGLRCTRKTKDPSGKCWQHKQ